MHILLLGGTGRTGRLIAGLLVKAGHSVTIAGRRDAQIPGTSFAETDLLDATALLAAAAGKDAVIAALASAKGNPVCSTVARALSAQSGLRFITIGGGAVDDLGDAKRTGDRVIGWIMRRIVPAMLADRQAELGILKKSALRWTMLRPPRLTDKPGTGRYRMTYDFPASTAIARADLAQAAVMLLTDDATVGRAPFVAG
jgi:uncharacterized protein YbjT (DUF2867 family)